MTVTEAPSIGPKAAAEWTPPDGWTVGTDANGRRESPILTCLRNLGPAAASEIATQLGRTTGNVGTQLRGFEDDGRVRRTGRTISGGRGGPQIEYELMPINGVPTGPETSIDAGTREPVDHRVARMAERVELLATNLERSEHELAGARQRAAEAEAAVRASEERRQAAERRAVAAEQRPDDSARVAELLEVRRDLEERLAIATESAETAGEETPPPRHRGRRGARRDAPQLLRRADGTGRQRRRGRAHLRPGRAADRRPVLR